MNLKYSQGFNESIGIQKSVNRTSKIDNLKIKNSKIDNRKIDPIRELAPSASELMEELLVERLILFLVAQR